MATDQDREATATPSETGDAGESVPKKKKTSVKVVKRVSKKKVSEKDSPATAAVSENPPIQEQENVAPEVAAPTPIKAAKSESSASVSEPVSQPVARRISSKRRAQRSGSNVFAMFTQNQVHQFKEAFSFIDQDKDGIISKNDIRSTFDALGRLCSEKDLDEMAKEAPGPINFTMFLTVFGDRVQGTDEEDVVLQAFSRYDEGDGFCSEQKLRHALMTWGEKFTKQECDVILQEAPVDSRGRIDIKKFATLVTRGDEDTEEAD